MVFRLCHGLISDWLYSVLGAPAHFACENDPDWAPSLRMGVVDKTPEDQNMQEKVAFKQPREATISEKACEQDHLSNDICVAENADSNRLSLVMSVDVDGSSRSIAMFDDCVNLGENEDVDPLNDSYNAFSKFNTSCSTVHGSQSYVSAVQLEDVLKELSELKKSYTSLRNKLTEAECDKVELENSFTEANSSQQKCEQEKQVLQQQISGITTELQESKKVLTSTEERLAESESKRCEVTNALEKCDTFFLSLDSLKKDEKKLKFYTGLPSYAVFDRVVSHVSAHVEFGKNASLEPWQGILLTMMRLRLSLNLQDLAYRFSISKATAGKCFEKWLYAMYICLDSLIVLPDRETLQKTMPKEFKESFGKNVAVIIDCFEIFIDKPSALDTRAQTWSNYKHHNTVKFLLGITPCGAISFVSEAWGGRVSDKHIAYNCGLFDKLLPDDIVMADRGFLIAEDLAFFHAKLLMPAFTRGQNQLNSQDVFETRKIAHLRIHVERVIGLVRNKYHILQNVMPVEFLTKKPGHNVAQIDEIVHVCCALTNLSKSVYVPNV